MVLTVEITPANGSYMQRNAVSCLGGANGESPVQFAAFVRQLRLVLYIDLIDVVGGVKS